MAAQPYRLVTVGQQMGIGVAGSMQVQLGAVGKANGPAAPYCIPNEMICAELGRFLRLPIPPWGIVRTAPTAPVWFASMDFNLAGNSLPPVDPVQCHTALPRESVGLLLFDILVANCDRHRGNFAVDYLTTPPVMSVFDHSHALFGYVAGNGQGRLQELRDRLGCSGGSRTGPNRHCMLDVISGDNDFAGWVGRIRALPDFFIEEVCRDAGEFGLNPGEVNEASSFLKHRRDNLMAIVQSHKTEFTAIQQWSLFP